ncbi:MAG: hypothetical protein ABIP65_03845 [Vicinamibacterales bacterium]
MDEQELLVLARVVAVHGGVGVAAGTDHLSVSAVNACRARAPTAVQTVTIPWSPGPRPKTPAIFPDAAPAA